MVVMILGWMLVGALVVLLLFPRTPVAKRLHSLLVEAPARALLDFSWSKLGKTVLLVAVFTVLAMAGPEMMMMFAALGADAMALEIILALWLGSMSGGFTSTWRKAKGAAAAVWRSLRFVAPRARTRSSRRNKRRVGRKTDDKEGPAPAWALA